MKPTLFDRLKPEYKAMLHYHDCDITKRATELMLKENYHIMFLPLIAVFNIRQIFKIEEIEILDINNLFNEPEEI